jgi:hypothetical protein
MVLVFALIFFHTGKEVSVHILCVYIYHFLRRCGLDDMIFPSEQMHKYKYFLSKLYITLPRRRTHVRQSIIVGNTEF